MTRGFILAVGCGNSVEADMCMDGGRWLSVRTLTGEEFFAEADMRKRGFKVFAPWHLRQRPAFKKTIVEKVSRFPGYLFACVDEEHSVYRLRKCFGVLSIVTHMEHPLPISDLVMQRIMSECTIDGYWPPSRSDAAAHKAYKIGDVVVIQQGPFTGFPGIVERLDGAGGLVLSLNIFGRATNVACSQDAVASNEAVPA